MQIKINNASFGFNGEDLFSGVTFDINSKDKIAIIGRNGCGKTTLLKILSGEYELHQPDNCPPVFEKIGNPSILTLSQMKFENETITLYEEVLKCYEKLIALETKIYKKSLR